jgi:hypothetical protein
MPEDGILHSHRYDNLKSYKEKVVISEIQICVTANNWPFCTSV